MIIHTYIISDFIKKGVKKRIPPKENIL